MKKFSLILALILSMITTACQGKDGIVHFGTYQQNSSTKDSISWIVLKVEGDKALLLSKDLISGSICKSLSIEWEIPTTNRENTFTE